MILATSAAGTRERERGTARGRATCQRMFVSFPLLMLGRAPPLFGLWLWLYRLSCRVPVTPPPSRAGPVATRIIAGRPLSAFATFGGPDCTDMYLVNSEDPACAPRLLSDSL